MSTIVNNNIVLHSPRLNSDSDGKPLYIQMVTALVCQLIQCVVHLTSEDPENERSKKVIKSSTYLNWIDVSIQWLFWILSCFILQVDRDTFITNSYETAMRTAQNFLSVFLKK